MSACAAVRPLLDLAPLELLDDEERRALEAHVEGCGACRAQLAALGVALAADRAAVEEETPPMSSSLRDRLVAAVPAVREHAEEKKAGPGPLTVDPARVDEVGRRIALSCSYCHGRTTRDEVAFCATCLAPHHVECFTTHGRCALPGCEEAAVVRPQLTSVGPVRRRRRRGPWIGLAALAAGLGGAVAALSGPERLDGYSPLVARVVEETTQASRELEAAAREGDRARAEALRAKLDLAPWLQDAITDGPEVRALLREHAERLRARADALLAEPRVTLDLQDVDLRAAVDALARQAGRNILVGRHVDERVTLSLRDVAWTEALRALAGLARCRIEPLRGGILSLTQPPAVTIQFTDANIRTVIQLLAAYSGKNVVIEPAVTGQLTMNFQEVPWDEALLALAAAHGFHVTLVGDVLLCSAEPRDGAPLSSRVWTGDVVAAPDDGALVDVVARDTPVRDVVASISRQSGQRIDVRGDLGRLSLDLQRAPWRAALEAVASSIPRGEVFELDGALVLRARPENRLRAARAPAGPWLQLLATLAEVNLVMPPDSGRALVTLDLADIDPLRAIEATVTTLGWRLERKDDLVRIVPVATPQAAGQDAASEAGQALRLEAVVMSGERRSAMLSGRVYAPGDTLLDANDEEIVGLVVEAVQLDGVTLRRSGVAEWLELPSAD